MAGFADRMSDSDALMWTIERDPLLRSTVTAVSILDRAPDFDAFVERVAAAGAVLPRLHQRVVEESLGLRLPRWVDCEYDPAYHLRRVAVPAAGGVDAALGIAAAAAMGGFDRTRPLWEFTIVEGLPGGQAAAILKIHHAMTDGIGLVRLALAILDLQRHPRRGLRVAPEPSDEPPPDAFKRGARLAAGVLGAAIRPRQLIAGLPAQIRSAAKLLAPVPAPLSPLMIVRTTDWRFDAFDTDLDALRGSAAAVGGTVNDAFVASVAGGLRLYHARAGAPVEQLRMTLPISIRAPGDPPGGNRFVPVRFPVPVGIADPAERMRALGELIRAWREEPSLRFSDTLAAGLNRLPPAAVTSVFGSMLKHVDFVATNVPGPPSPVYMAGAKLLRQYAFAPLTGAPINVALVSYGTLGCVGINADAGAIGDMAALGTAMRDGFAEVAGHPLEERRTS